MYKKHSLEERLLAVQKCLDGYPPYHVGREMGINESCISEWVLCYNKDGIEGLQKRPNKRTNFEEKCKLVYMFVEKGISLHRISAEHSVSQSALSSWIRIYRKGGYDALRTIKSPGRSRKDMVRPKKQVPQTELERLRYENEWLRAENALLKKVRALMEEKERQQREIGRKPSKH